MSNSDAHDRANDVDASATTPAHRYDATVAPRVIDSAALLNGRSHLAILHNETVYFLRQTRFGKLILTK